MFFGESARYRNRGRGQPKRGAPYPTAGPIRAALQDVPAPACRCGTAADEITQSFNSRIMKSFATPAHSFPKEQVNEQSDPKRR